MFILREENQLDATEWLITLIICSTCFKHFYAHHQELETILVLLPHMVWDALVAGGQRSVAGQQAMRSGCVRHYTPYAAVTHV
jgi:hypothetical protein